MIHTQMYRHITPHIPYADISLKVNCKIPDTFKNNVYTHTKKITFVNAAGKQQLHPDCKPITYARTA
jgi:hypothetical protein